MATPSQRLRYTVDPFGGVPTEARNVSVKISWSSATATPVLYLVGVSFIPRVDETKTRVTDWDSANALGDKYLKGVILEVDTLGVSRTIAIQVDGATYTTISVPATTKGRRQIFQFSFPETLGRYFRLLPVDESKWQLFQYQWIFDEEPLSLPRWETQELAHGIAEWKTPLFANVTLRSTAPVTFTIQCFNQSGVVRENVYTIPTTNGAKVKTYVQLVASKGILIKYILSSSVAFTLYREETDVAIIPWGAEKFGTVHPFGNDDLDLTRGMYRASGVAERQGGGGGAVGGGGLAN